MKKPYKKSAVKKHTVPSTYGVTEKLGNPFTILSQPDKMPCPTFSLPACKSCPFKVTGDNAICSDCYAMKGRYVMQNVVAPRCARFAWILDCIRNGREAEVIDAIVAAIKATGTKHFRGHDSGDFFNPKYVDVWTQICAQLPDVRFWFPTRSWQIGQSNPGAPNNRMLQALRRLQALSNVTVKPSALYFGDPAPVVNGLGAGSTSDNADTFTCPAYANDGYCGTCRECWNKDTEVSYKHH